MMEVKNISYHYHGGGEVLKNVNVTLEQGDRKSVGRERVC